MKAARQCAILEDIHYVKNSHSSGGGGIGEGIAGAYSLKTLVATKVRHRGLDLPMLKT